MQEISVRHTRALFGGNIGILFYDVTTLYFETTCKDELRNNSFSKDGKNANPQVVLGLLVSRGGYPLSYALFNVAQFEGYTMIPIVDDFVQRYKLGSDFVVIADAGLMSDKNVKLLRSAGYKYIIGARLKKESGAMKERILSTPHKQGVFNDIKCDDGDRLVVGYSEERARKNEHDRNEGVERLRKRYAKGTLEVRPMFHFGERRNEAHICICFVALKVYKELERLLKVSGCPYSVDDVLRISEVIVTLEVDLPENGKTLTKTIYTSKEERDIAYLIETDNWLPLPPKNG